MTRTTGSIGDRVLDGSLAHVYDRDLISDDATLWHNFDEVDIPYSDSLSRITAITAVVPDFRMEDRRGHDLGDVSIIQYTVKGTLPDGSTMRVPGCMVITLRNGKVVRMQEYVDTAQLATFRAAMAAAPVVG